MKSFLRSLVIFSLLIVGSFLFANGIKVYFSPSSLFFSDGVVVGGSVGADLKIGYSKFSSSDTIKLSPEVGFYFIQKEGYSFSSFGINLFPSYDMFVYSFEKKYNTYVKFGIGVGVSYSATKVQNVEYSGFMLNVEPTIGVNYNFYENMWIGVNFRYKISSEFGNKISSFYAPNILVPFSIEF